MGDPEIFTESDDRSIPETKEINIQKRQEGRVQIAVMDTPGLLYPNEYSHNESVMIRIAEEVMMKMKGGVHLFLLVCDSMTVEGEVIDAIEVSSFI